jgi:hypothetical protein
MAKEKKKLSEMKELKFEGIPEPREITFTELCERLMIPEFSKAILERILPEKFSILPPTVNKGVISFGIAYDINDKLKVEGKLKIKNLGTDKWECKFVTAETTVSTKGTKERCES